jgi:hypothetical protein
MKLTEQHPVVQKILDSEHITDEERLFALSELLSAESKVNFRYYETLLSSLFTWAYDDGDDGEEVAGVSHNYWDTLDRKIYNKPSGSFFLPS